MAHDDSDQPRDAIHEAIQHNYSPPKSILTGWALVAEWMTEDGDRVLGKARASDTTPWNAKGMLFEMLFERTSDWEVSRSDSPEAGTDDLPASPQDSR